MSLGAICVMMNEFDSVSRKSADFDSARQLDLVNSQWTTHLLLVEYVFGICC